MNYIQIEFLGKLRGLKFNQGALIEYRDKADFNSHQATAAYAMFWAGLKANAYVKGEEFTKEVDGKEVLITFEDVCDEVDNLSDEVVLSVLNAFQSSKSYLKLVQVKEEDEVEKKSELITEPNAISLPED